MKTSKNIIKVKLKEKIIVEAVTEKGREVWEEKKKENQQMDTVQIPGMRTL